MNSRLAAATAAIVLLWHGTAFAQMCAPAAGVGTQQITAQAAQQIPEKWWLRPGDTVTWQSGQGFHGVFFDKFGENEFYDFKDVQKIFDMDLKQFTSISSDGKTASTDGKNAPAVLLTAKVKADAGDVGLDVLSFWCSIHGDQMSGMLKIGKAQPGSPQRTFTVIGKRGPGRQLIWAISDGKEEFTLPAEASSGVTASMATCPCMAAMAAVRSAGQSDRSQAGMGGMMQGCMGMMQGGMAGATQVSAAGMCPMMAQPARSPSAGQGSSPSPQSPRQNMPMQMPGMQMPGMRQ